MARGRGLRGRRGGAGGVGTPEADGAVRRGGEEVVCWGVDREAVYDSLVAKEFRYGANNSPRFLIVMIVDH